MRKILFICTANYYRSRFAEAVFNHLAERRGLEWAAFSRGFTPEEAPPGLSPHTWNGLRLVGVDPSLISKEKQKLEASDFEEADRAIALKQAEHEPMMQANFPEHLESVEYWHIDDIPLCSPPEALLAIKTKVEELVDQLDSQAKEAH